MWLTYAVLAAGFAVAMFASDVFFIRGLTAITVGDEALAVQS